MKYYSDRIESAFPRLLAAIVLGLLISWVIGCGSATAPPSGEYFPARYTLVSVRGFAVPAYTFGQPSGPYVRVISGAVTLESATRLRVAQLTEIKDCAGCQVRSTLTDIAGTYVKDASGQLAITFTSGGGPVPGELVGAVLSVDYSDGRYRYSR